MLLNVAAKPAMRRFAAIFWAENQFSWKLWQGFLCPYMVINRHRPVLAYHIVWPIILQRGIAPRTVITGDIGLSFQWEMPIFQPEDPALTDRSQNSH
jgi:hypothetical protein